MPETHTGRIYEFVTAKKRFSASIKMQHSSSNKNSDTPGREKFSNYVRQLSIVTLYSSLTNLKNIYLYDIADQAAAKQIYFFFQ